MRGAAKMLIRNSIHPALVACPEHQMAVHRVVHRDVVRLYRRHQLMVLALARVDVALSRSS
jgi:hypothetical protein